MSRRLGSMNPKALAWSSFSAPSTSLASASASIDHHVQMMAELCDHLIVLHFGNKIADGPTEAVVRDEKVIEVYLGAES